jgi:hypothetical protein
MDRFHVIEDAHAILRTKGVYRQSRVYRRGPDVFAGHGAGYIRLLGRGDTTVPDVKWLDLEADGVRQAGESAPPKWTAPA